MSEFFNQLLDLKTVSSSSETQTVCFDHFHRVMFFFVSNKNRVGLIGIIVLLNYQNYV